MGLANRAAFTRFQPRSVKCSRRALGLDEMGQDKPYVPYTNPLEPTVTHLPPPSGQPAFERPAPPPPPAGATPYAPGAPALQAAPVAAAVGTQPSAVLAILALVFGIIAIIIFPLLGILGVAAVIMGVMGVKRASQGTATKPGLAIAGIVTGALGAVLMIGFWVIGLIGMATTGGVTP